MQTSLYIHFPFCLKKCPYCDFNSVADARVAPEEYVAVLLREMELRAERLSASATAPTLYFGGGTPSLMGPEPVGRIIDAAARLYGLEADAEVTLEANPGTLTPESLAGYRAAGVNRLSIGVQSLDDAALELLGRVHTARQALDSFEAARSVGFGNIGIDLIHSLPGQTPAMWENDLGRAIALGPEHVSAYALSVEEGTPFARLAAEGSLSLPAEGEAVRMFRATRDILRSAGYEQYEISNFSLPGFRSRHNQVYWRRGNYLGFGAGAHSFLREEASGTRWKNRASPSGYLRAVQGGSIPEEEKEEVARKDAMAEFLFLGLRMLEGVDTELFTAEFGVTVEDAYGEEISRLLQEGLLEREGRRLRLADGALILSNQVFLRFL